LEKIEYPKPNREFIYDTFNEFSRKHPWVGQENIRPKSVAREMVETFQSFHDYIKEYDLERVEGLLLRYLSEVYKVLLQTIPEPAKTDELVAIIEYLRTLLKDVDSSLVEEWENLRTPELAAQRAADKKLKEDAREAEALARKEAERLQKQKIISLRNEVFRGMRFLYNADYANAALVFPRGDSSSTADELEAKMKEYFLDHSRLLIDMKARAAHFSQITELGENRYQLVQTLVDADEHNDWALTVEAEFTNGPKLNFLSLKSLN
ncbi:MAG: DUF3516 domain-containing protein, partial [Bdellovibrionales bacterium]|nr:DUF3516 domain-containing protein [Oligoflexia bacterium]